MTCFATGLISFGKSLDVGCICLGETDLVNGDLIIGDFGGDGLVTVVLVLGILITGGLISFFFFLTGRTIIGVYIGMTSVLVRSRSPYRKNGLLSVHLLGLGTFVELLSVLRPPMMMIS